MHSSTLDTIDNSKNIEIRSVRFLDADTLKWMFPVANGGGKFEKFPY
jgi:hypothetical protein